MRKREVIYVINKHNEHNEQEVGLGAKQIDKT